jgi:hypothetical protein
VLAAFLGTLGGQLRRAGLLGGQLLGCHVGPMLGGLAFEPRFESRLRLFPFPISSSNPGVALGVALSPLATSFVLGQRSSACVGRPVHGLSLVIRSCWEGQAPLADAGGVGVVDLVVDAFHDFLEPAVEFRAGVGLG